METLHGVRIHLWQGLGLNFGGEGFRPGARGQALTASLGTVPSDSTAPGLPGGPLGDLGEASGEWGHCGLPGSGEWYEGRYCA